VSARLLFLDFDGVMHPAGCTVDLYFCQLGLLQAWLGQRPDVDIVVSSSWREHHPLDEIQSYFASEIATRVIDVTPVLKPNSLTQYDGGLPQECFEREAEVNRWLHANNAHGTSWAALDDQASLFKPRNPHLVLCDGRIGLTQRALDEVEKVFQAQAGQGALA